MSDSAVNEDPYGFTWAYPTLFIVGFVSLWFEAYAAIAACVMIAGMIALTMGLHLNRHLLPLNYATVHRSKSPRLFWTYTVLQAGVVVLAVGTGLGLLAGWIG